jgi:hypothetical protein
MPTEAKPPPETPANIPARTPDPAQFNRDVQDHRSPDGRWSLRVLVAFPAEGSGAEQFYTRLWLVDLQTGEADTVDENWGPYGLGFSTPAFLGWTEDSRFVFLTSRSYPDGCGLPFNSGLIRIEADSGAQETYPFEGRGPAAVAPDGTTAITFEENALLLTYLADGRKAALAYESPPGDFQPVGLVYSPDGKQAVFSLYPDRCAGSPTRTSWLVAADLQNRETSVLLRDDSHQHQPIRWAMPGLVQLRSASGVDAWLDWPGKAVSQQPPEDISVALAALQEFFAALSERRYADADRYFGGSYEALTGFNPDLDPTDRIALWAAGCEKNGLVCLPANDIVLDAQPGEGEYRFLVSFRSGDVMFSLGPCCGADITEMPPQWQFAYTLKQDDSQVWRVMEMPPYQP